MANVTKKSERKDRTLAIVIMSASVLLTGITAGNAITNNADAPTPAPTVVESASSTDNENEIEWISTSQNKASVGSVKGLGSIPGK